MTRSFAGDDWPDLKTCDQEPIHIPGGIQSHGILFVLSSDRAESWKITHASENAPDFFGKPIEKILGSSFLDWVETSSLEIISTRLNTETFVDLNPVPILLRGEEGVLRFDGIIHRHKGKLFLELEPLEKDSSPISIHPTRVARKVISHLREAQNLQQLCDIAVQEVRALTGFDRVVMYKFDENWNGEVIAEAKASGCVAFLGLHFPSSDIPKQARELYQMNGLRMISSVNYKMARILSLPEFATEPLDLSLAVLRSVSPIHLEYLRNMKATASMSVSILKDGELWGLISCTHEGGPKYLSYELRLGCEFVGEMVASLISAKQGLEDSDYRIQLKSCQATLLQLMSNQKNFVRGLVEFHPNLLSVAGAEGAAVYLDGQCTLLGNTPGSEDIEAFIHWLSERPFEELFVTDSLSSLYPPAKKFKECASGVMAAILSKSKKSYVLWFRPEVIQVVSWGGNPQKPLEQTEGSMRIHPRKSFDLWKEVVKEKAIPWKRVEKEAAVELRKSIIDVILQRSEQLSKLNLELERSNIELDAFAYAASHDLKEPLRGIHNYTHLVIKELGPTHLVGQSGDRLKTVLKLTQRMEELINSLLFYSQVGRMGLNFRRTHVKQVVDDALEVLKPRLDSSTVEVQVDSNLPWVLCDPVLTGEVFTNLISNALKYNDKSEKYIKIGTFFEGNFPVFFVRDNGLGIREKNYESIFRIFKRLHKHDQYGGGSGTGLTITKRIIERHGGRVWLESKLGVGTTFFFTLGSEVV